MSILSAAIDSARSGEKSKRGMTGALRGSTENQQSEQERYTALSLKQELGGQSILSAAIDSARNEKKTERVTGSLEIPERYLGLGSGSGGFRSYTPRGSGFQKDQDVMGEFLNSEVQRTQSAMRLKGLELENSYGALKKAQESITLIEGNMKALYQSYQANPTDEGYQLYERAYAAYQKALGGYDAAAVDFNRAREEYDPLESAHELATGNYQEYAAKKTQEYNAWRNSIRDTGTIQREMAEVEAPRKDLEMERIDLTKENDALEGEMARARADGNSALVDELRRKQWENMERSQEIERQLARLDEAKETLKEELEWARYFRYQDLTQEKDFQELSRYKSTETGEEPIFNSWSGTYSNTGYGDIAYDVINRNQDAMSKQDLSNIQSGAAFLGLDSSEREQMTNEEIGIFNYLYAKEGKDAAYAYIDYLTSDLNYRQRKQEEEEWAAYAEEKPVEASVFSVLESPLKGLSYIGQIADYAEDGTIDQNAGYNKFSYLNSAIRDQVTEDVEAKWGGVGSFAYQTGMSMADFLLSTAVSGGNQGVALAIMGTGAAADATIRAKDRGLSDDKAFALGTIAGAAEILTEKVSLDALLDTAKMGKGVLGYFLKNTIAEGSEEVASDFINLFADIIIAQDESEWRQSIKAYQDIGESEESAFWKAFTDQAINMGLDFLGGAISGAVFSGAVIGIDRASGAIQQRGQRVETQQQEGQVRQEESDRQEEQPDLREDAEDGITLPTAEELLGQNRETPEAGIYDSGITLPTAEEGGVLPTAEQTEVRKRAARAKTELERSGILAGAREADIQTAQRLSNVLRRSIRFYDGSARSDTSGGAEGYYERSTDTIYVNSRSKNPVAQIIAHELTHSVELAEAYTDLSDLVFERIRQTGGDLEEMRWAKRELYERKGQRLSEERIDREIVAKYVENNLLTDEKSILELTRLNRRLGQKILNWINGILAKIGNANAQEQVFLTRARDAYARALRETQSSFTSEQVQATPEHEGQDMEKTGGQAEETPAREKTKNEEETQTRRDQARDALRKIREEYAAGNITEEEFDAALDAVMEAEGLAGEEMLEYSIGGDETDGRLPGGQDDGKMRKTRYAAGKETEYGNRRRKESRVEFTSRSRRGTGTVREIGRVAVSYGEVGPFDTSFRAEEAGEELRKLGIPFFYHDGLEYNVDGTTYTDDGEAATIGGAEVGINRRAFSDGKLIAGHEAYHLWAANGSTERYERVLIENLDPLSDYWYEQYQVVAEQYGNDRHLLREEFFARLSGQLHSGLYDAQLGTIFRDFEAVKAAWAELVQANGRKRQFSLKPEDAVDRKKVLRELKGILDRGGNAQDLRRYLDTLDGDGRRARDQGGEKDSAAENIVREAHGQDLSVDEFLRQNWERYEYDGAMNEDARAALELERQSGRQYSIDENYERDIDDWERRGRPDGEVFILGSTGDVLQGLGAMEQNIYLRSEKVNTILKEHPEMTLAEIKRIPEILDDPVLVIKSNGSSRSGQNTRLVMTGSLRTQNGRPVMAVLDLRPVEGRLVIDDMQKVNSAYGRSNAANYIQNSEVLYADKKRTIPLLKSMGLQSRPIELQRYGSMGSISYFKRSVNIRGVPFDQVVNTTWQREGSGRQYSMEGEIELPTAEELLERERQSVVDTLPAKARNYLRQKENILLGKVGKALNVPRYAQREYLKDIVREISEEYLRSGKVSGETIDKLFERAYDEGIVADRTFREEYDELWEFLRATHLTISKEDSAGIQDFNDFRRSNFGRLNLSTTGETNIDRVYQELETRWPEFFSEARVSHPADQLLHIADVARAFRVAERTLDEYYGPNADEYRQWARNDFEAAIGEMMGELRTVRRYTDERSSRESLKAQGGEYAAPTTQEEVTALWGRVKEARRAYEKVYARNLLTESDERQLGKLMRGEIALEDLNQESDNVRGIRAVYEVKQEYERLTNAIREWNRSRKEALRQEADRLLETANDWKDKKAGILYSRETMERNIRDIVKDRELAEEIIKTYFTPVHEATANANRLKNDLRSRVRKLELSRKVTAGNQVSEAHAVQLLGEAEDNIRMLEQSRGRLKTRDGKTLEEWRAVVRELWEENTDLDEGKIRAAVAQFRAIYDDLFQKMNEARIRYGYEPVNYRKGYFPHFQPGDGDGILAQFGRALGISTEVTALPTTINGLTHTFRPGIRWFGNALERTGFNTAYDAVEGFDRYIEGVADVIYHTDDIQRLRALATQARYRTSDQGLREQVDRVLADPTVAEQDKQSRIEKIYENGRYTLSNFVAELDEYTNLLANKKSITDRAVEKDVNRQKIYRLAKWIQGRTAANMVAVNPASWLTNFIPLTQGGAMLDRGQLLKGMWDTLKAYRESDGIVDRSTFLTNRRGSEPLVRTWQQSASATMSKPMEYIDQFVADSLVRARYRQNQDMGLSEDAAMSEADAWVAGVMADRSKGATPTLFNRSNFLTKLLTTFQLEVNNQLSYLFKDMPRDARDKGLRVLAAALIKFFLGAFLYNEVYEYFIGRRPALDPIGILNDTVGDLTGWELPNLVELGTGAVTGELPSFRVEQQSVYDTVTGMGESMAEQIPFVGSLLGGGRLPISSALPDWENLGRAVLGDSWSEEKRVATIAGELGNPLTYLALPFGGGQLKKIYQGIKAAVQGGKYAVNADGEDILQYPMYTDTPLEAILNTATAMLFGTTALQTGQDWIESGFQSLGVAQTEVYQGMLEAGVPGEDAYALIQSLAGAEKTEAESEAEQERNILREAGISGEAKSVVYYGLMASEKERELMDALADRENMGEVVETLMDIKDAGKMTGAAASNAKRDAIANAAISERAQREIYNYTFGTRQDDGTYISSRDDDIAAFQAEGLSFEQFLEAQNQYSQISEEYEEAEQKAVEFSRWVNGQGLTDSQAAVVKESFSYFTQIPKSGGYYDKFVAAGLGDQEAYDLSNALDDLEPEEGKTQVSSLQRYRAVVDAGLDEDQQIAALGELMSESEYGKLKMGYSFDVPPATYVRFKEVLPAFDEDGNGGYTQSEVEAALDGMGGGEIILPTTGGIGGIYMTTAQKATLWQLQNKSWKPENNPFSVSVGQQVYEAMNAED